MPTAYPEGILVYDTSSVLKHVETFVSLNLSDWLCYVTWFSYVLLRLKPRLAVPSSAPRMPYLAIASQRLARRPRC